MGLLEDLLNLGNGVRSGVGDVPGFVRDVLTGDVHGAVTDGRKIIGGVGDVLHGVEGLGVHMGPVPARYAGTAGKIADSPILAGAQLAIEAQKALTGSGAPEDGNGYRESAKRLNEAVETLVDASPQNDRWDGAASQEYKGINDSHRVHTSNVQVADEKIGEILSIEAGQVSRARRTLDETSQGLYDYGLATAWMNVVPGLNAAKLAADTAAAAAALTTTDTTISMLSKNALENALRIRSLITTYEGVATDKSGDGGTCGTFIPPESDLNDLPSRLDADKPYTVPPPENPRSGPPAIPYGSPPVEPPAPPATTEGEK